MGQTRLLGIPENTRDSATASARAADSTSPERAGESAKPVQERELLIRAHEGFRWIEALEYRELLYFLIWRDIKVRYKQTALGVTWALLQPLFNMLLFTLIFGRFAKLPSQGLPYAIFVFVGLIPWTFFSNGVAQSGQSLVNQEHLLTKIYFPRVLVPVASFGTPMVDMLVSFTLLAGMMIIYKVIPGWGVLWLPLLVGLTLLTGLSVGVALAALTVRYRDFRFVVPFMMQAWMFASPVIYPVTLLPERYQWILSLNPMAGIIDAYRSALLGTPWHLTSLAISVTTAIGLLVASLFWFKRTERQLADIV